MDWKLVAFHSRRPTSSLASPVSLEFRASFGRSPSCKKVLEYSQQQLSPYLTLIGSGIRFPFSLFGSSFLTGVGSHSVSSSTSTSLTPVVAGVGLWVRALSVALWGSSRYDRLKLLHWVFSKALINLSELTEFARSFLGSFSVNWFFSVGQLLLDALLKP